MSLRYAPVRDRCIQAVRDQLLTIRQDNGYNTNVKQVDISRQLPTIPVESDVIQMVILMSNPSVWCTGRTYEDLFFELWYYRQRLERVDQEFNLFEDDIKRALFCPLQDLLHPNPQQTGIQCEWLSTIPLYDVPGSSTVVGLMRYKMEYFHDLEDSRIWDTSDILVEYPE